MRTVRKERGVAEGRNEKGRYQMIGKLPHTGVSL